MQFPGLSQGGGRVEYGSLSKVGRRDRDDPRTWPRTRTRNRLCTRRFLARFFGSGLSSGSRGGRQRSFYTCRRAESDRGRSRVQSLLLSVLNQLMRFRVLFRGRLTIIGSHFRGFELREWRRKYGFGRRNGTRSRDVTEQNVTPQTSEQNPEVQWVTSYVTSLVSFVGTHHSSPSSNRRSHRVLEPRVFPTLSSSEISFRSPSPSGLHWEGSRTLSSVSDEWICTGLNGQVSQTDGVTLRSMVDNNYLRSPDSLGRSTLRIRVRTNLGRSRPTGVENDETWLNPLFMERHSWVILLGK